MTRWYVADGICDLDGPFATKAEADKVVRRIKRERSGEEYHPNGWTLPIWVPRACQRWTPDVPERPDPEPRP